MKKRWTSILLAAIMVMGMTSGCGNKPAEGTDTGANNSSAATSDEGDSGELVPITWSMCDNDYDVETWPTEVFTDYQEALREYAGVEITFEGYDSQELDLALASSDLPDILTVKRDYCNTLLTGKKVVNMDDYIDLAPNLKSLSPVREAAMREYFSNGDGGWYFWTPYVGYESTGAELWNGFTVRWDWYKELGYPEVTNEDEFLNVVKQIVDAHPTTENGDKVYGVATFSDGTLWGWWVLGCYYGYHNITDNYSVRLTDSQVINNFTTLDSPVWRSIEYYYKANQLGIFDPDSLTMKGDDLNAKATNGQIVSPVCTWYGGKLYSNSKVEDPNSLAGYMVLPMEGQYNWDNAHSDIGWSFYTAAIADSPYVEQVMKVFDYMNSEEGARMCYMGAEGREWETVSDTPTIKDEYIDIKLNGSANEVTTKTSGIWGGIIGTAGTTVLSDGGQAELWNTPEVWKKSLTPLQKDFCEHYGVEVPAEAARNLVAEGKAYDKSVDDTLSMDIVALLPSAPQDITRIDTRCLDIMIKAIPNLVLAENQEEFDRIQQETLAELEGADIQKSIDWYTEQANSIREFLQSVQ